jgi:tetratricopeptide (TPR) repeat protein
MAPAPPVLSSGEVIGTMLKSVRFWLALLAATLAVAPLCAQAPADLPAVHVPLKPADRRDLDHVEALKAFARGAIAERHHRLIEAVHAYEEAARLDPDAAAPLRALAPLYLALDRTDDALEAYRKALELDPEDVDTSYFYARQLRAADKQKEAIAVLNRTAARPGLKDRPELRLQICTDLGALYETAGDVKRAEAALRDAAAILDGKGEGTSPLLELGTFTRPEIDSQASEIYERLGRLCLKAGRTDQAIADFEKACKKDASRAARLSYNLAEVYAGQGKTSEALKRLEEYLQTQPLGVEGYELKITLQRKLGRDAAVVPDLEAACGHDAQNAALKLLLAREYHKAGRNAEAEKAYAELARDGPTAVIYRSLFDLYQENAGGAARILNALDETAAAASEKGDKPGDLSAAAQARAMLQVLRGDGDLVKKLLVEAKPRLTGRPGLAFQTRLLLAALAARTGKLDIAEELYRACLDRDGGVSRGDEQEVYFGLLRVLMLAHKYDEVVAVATRGLKNENTHLAPLYEDLALAQMALGCDAEALEAAEEVVRKAGDADSRLRYRLFRAEVLSRIGKHAEAEAECLALLKEYNTPGDVREIRMVLSAAYSLAHKHDQSEEQLQLILNTDDDDATANNDLGYQWADRSKNLPEAEKRIRKALVLDRKQRNSGDALVLDGDQDNASFVDSLGWVLFRESRGEVTSPLLAEARRELERAVSLQGGADSPEVWDHLGDVYFRSEMKAKAGEAWRMAVDLYDSTHHRPDDRLPEIKEKLRLLKP